MSILKSNVFNGQTLTTELVKQGIEQILGGYVGITSATAISSKTVDASGINIIEITGSNTVLSAIIFADLTALSSQGDKKIVTVFNNTGTAVQLVHNDQTITNAKTRLNIGADIVLANQTFIQLLWTNTGWISANSTNSLSGTIDASQVTTGTLSDARLSTNVTVQGNTFNTSNKLVQLDANAKLPAVDASKLTNLAADQVTTGKLNDARLSTNVTVQGNTFNQASKLVQLDSETKLPAVDASQVTNLDVSKATLGTLSDARLSQNVTVQGNVFNEASKLVQLDANAKLPVTDGSQVTNLNANNISTGTVNDARLSLNVTTQGNVFNTADKLVQLDANAKLPAVDASLVTNLNADQLVSGTVSDARLSTNVTAQGNVFNEANKLVQLDADLKLPVSDGSQVTNVTAEYYIGTITDAQLSSNVTVQGNTFNAADELVILDGEAKLPAIDGSQLINLTKAQVGLGNVPNVDTSDAANITSGKLSNTILNSDVTIKGNTFNGIDELVTTTAEGKLPALSGENLIGLTKAQVGLGNVPNIDATNADNLLTGTVSTDRLPTTITLQGNDFNGSLQLVLTGIDGKIPSSLLPSSVINKVTVVATQADMLAQVDMVVGDVTVVNADPEASNNGPYILANLPSDNLANWQVLSYGDAVLTVNGKPGPNVELLKQDIGLGNVPNIDATNASNINTGTLPVAQLPLGSNTTVGATRGDGETINIVDGVASTTTPVITERELINGEYDLVALDWSANTVVYKYATAVVPSQSSVVDIVLDVANKKVGYQKQFVFINNTETIVNQIQFNIASSDAAVIVYNDTQGYYSFNPQSAIIGTFECLNNNTIIINWSQGEVVQISGINQIISSDNSVLCLSTGSGLINSIISSDNSIIVTSTGESNVGEVLSSDDSILINII